MDQDGGSRKDFILARFIDMIATTACCVPPDRWFTPHFAIFTKFSLFARDATVDMAKVCSPFWQTSCVGYLDRSRGSQSPTVQNIWDVLHS